MAKKYTMTISRLTVDKLGVKLYDRVSAVIAELVANSYDADAETVIVTAPMGELLAQKSGGELVDKGYSIEVVDDGHGMMPEEINDFYLKVGAERRKDKKRGDTSRKFKRKVMGRKGVGKLAPFGVCHRIEVITSGGKPTTGKDENGNTIKGYRTAHLILERDKIIKDTDEEYHPKEGELDEVVRKESGTTIRLTMFDHRYVPALDDFERELARRFGVPTANWRIELRDSLLTPGDSKYKRQVGEFDTAVKPETVIKFLAKPSKNGAAKYQTVGPNGKVINDIPPFFKYEGQSYYVTGWAGYSKNPYKDDLMAGIRLYCRGKIAGQTSIFNMKAGFTGEFDIRSYLIGELHCDWLDEEEDLIRTDRQDILWSHDLGQAFEEWGQKLVKRIGAITREPMRKKSWDTFQEKSKIEEKVEKAFPAAGQREIRENTIEMAKLIASTTKDEDLNDVEHVDSLVSLSMLLGPHVTLRNKLREAVEKSNDPLAAVTGILKTARVAELSAFGQIAEDRVKVIKKVEKLKDKSKTLEAAFQELIESAPWLVNPQWSPLTANKSFETLKVEFQKFYKQRTGKTLVLDPFVESNKRADFVLSNQDNAIQIIEIKKPGHALGDGELDRIVTYVKLMREFLNEPANGEFKELFPKFHVTLVCDKLGLSETHKTAFEGLVEKRRLTHINWRSFLLRTQRAHEDFLKEAERQRKNAAKTY